MTELQSLAERRLIRAGEILAAGQDGLKVLVIMPSDYPCVLTYQGEPLLPARPDPCSSRVRRRAAQGLPLQPGDVLIDDQSGLVVRCIRGATGEVRCNGRRLLLR
jgi:hypothetical protein